MSGSIVATPDERFRYLLVESLSDDRHGPATVRGVFPVRRCGDPVEPPVREFEELAAAAGQANPDRRYRLGRFALWCVDCEADLHAFAVGDRVCIRFLGTWRIIAPASDADRGAGTR